MHCCMKMYPKHVLILTGTIQVMIVTKKYTVDCRINGLPKPLFVYGLSNNDRIRDATIKLQKVIQWNIPFLPLGIFQDREVANRQVVARFDDVCPMQFPNMESNRNEIITYIEENI